MDTSSLIGPGYLVTKLGHRITAQFADDLASLGMRPRHYGALVAIASAPTSSQQELGQRIGVVASAVVAVVDELVALGAIERTVDAANRRRTIITLTEAGALLLERAAAVGRSVDAAVFGVLSETERAVLVGLLAKLN